MIDFRQLVKAGVHFGHQTSRWCPKMAPFIWGHKNKVHLIDVSKTAFQLEKAAKFLEGVTADNGTILWVGTKKAAQNIVRDTANTLKMPYVNHRWIGGTLSNFNQVKKAVTKYLHYKDVLDKSDQFSHYTKKERMVMQKAVDKLEVGIGGIQNLTWPVHAVVLVDVGKEHSALLEAVSMGVPVVALVDTNCDPSLVDYAIPANDDAPRSIKVIIDYLAQATQKGQVAVKAKKADAAAAQKAEKEKTGKAAAPVKKAAVPVKKDIAIKKAATPKETVTVKKTDTKKAVAPKEEKTTSEKPVVKKKPGAKASAPKKSSSE